MNEEIKNELDQIGNLVDSKIEKAFNSAKDNAKGEIETSLKSEIDNLSTEFLAKHEEATKRMDNFEVAQKKAVSSSQPTNFKSSLIKSINDGAIDYFLSVLVHMPKRLGAIAFPGITEHMDWSVLYFWIL